MASAPYAFTVHHFINSVGSDAGFAAIIGLAILVLLFFAQARETASLREQAHQSAQRVAQLEARLSQLLRGHGEPAPSRAQPAPAPPGFSKPATGPFPAAGAPPPPAVGSGGPLPAAPAGVGAPALTDATRLIPVSARAPVGAAPAPSVPAPAPPAAAAANGSVRDALENGTGLGPAGSGGAQPQPRVQIQPDAGGAGGRRPGGLLHPLLAQPSRRRNGGRAAALALTVVVAVGGGAVALLLVLTSGSGKQQPEPRSTTTSNATVTHRTQAVAFKPGSVTVAVLNGTAIAGLAGNYSQQLGRDGYKIDTTTNAADQTHSSTIVAYIQGQKAAALRVASSLALRAAAVQPIDPSTQAIACPPPSPCADDVVVTLGSDLAARA